MKPSVNCIVRFEMGANMHRLGDNCPQPLLRDLARDIIKDLDDHSYELVMDVFLNAFSGCITCLSQGGWF